MTDPRPAPYPADTRAKGWRFELDHERIRQSDTWALAPAEVRPWLLMLWMVAWEQTPCASLPSDDELIAARMGMPVKTFAKHRAVLLRGWWTAEDGRLYHDVMSERVGAMLVKREKDQARAAAARARAADKQVGSAGVTHASRVTSAESEPSSTPSTKHQAPTTSPAEKKAPRKRDAGPDCPDDIDPQVWSDWLELRQKKRAPVTATVLEGARAESAKAGLTFEAFLRVWCRRGTQGLEAEWLKPHERSQGPPIETPYARQMRERAQVLAPGVAAKAPGQQTHLTVIEADGNDQQKLIA